MALPAPRSRAAGIRDALEDAILTGVHEAGSRLDEQELARCFGVSRTPVREALAQLASTALVDLVPNRGAFVRRVSIRDVVQMFEVMAELEAMAGRLAARRAGPEAISRLAACHARCEAAAEAGDPDAYNHENSLFHGAIYEASGNDYLAAETTRLHQRLKAYRRLQLRVPRRMGQSLAEHRRIVAAISTGDAAAAAAELRDHTTIQGDRFTDFVATLARKGAAE